MAGLAALYDADTHYYLYVSFDEEQRKCLNILSLDRGEPGWPLDQAICIGGWKHVYLNVTFDYESLQFAYSQDGATWKTIGPALDATKLSDEYTGGFTGAFIGICVQDLSGQHKYADFDWFEYTELL